MATARHSAEAIAAFKRNMADRNWRLCNLYFILDRDGNKIKFEPNWAQQRLMEEWSHRNIILKSRQIGFCLDPATKVLTADLRWVPISELEPGQQVVAVDEEAPGGRGQARKMRTAVVEGVVQVLRKAYRVTFDDGRSVVCTAQHPWLSRNSGPFQYWRSIEGVGDGAKKRKLRVGTEVRWITKPWAEPSFEDGWFGGMLDGEGSFAKHERSASVTVSQRPGAVWERLKRYCDERGYAYHVESDKCERASKYGSTPVPKLRLGRLDELFRLIGQTRPTRFIGRRFWEGRELPGKRSGIGWAKIVSIEPLGEQVMIDLQTTTGTYIAEGFVSHNTTFIQLLFLDLILFNSNMRCGTIAQDRDTAKAIFQDKIRTPYDWLPEGIKAQRFPIRDSASELALNNNSVLRVGTSMRGGTLQYLHVSEFGKTCARWPEKAREIITGSLNTVKAGQYVFIESTAEGQEGQFFKMTEKARAQARSGSPLSTIDYKFHFYGWHEDPNCWIDPAGVVITEEAQRHFAQLERDHGIVLNAGQRAWWTVTQETQLDDMGREYPAHPDEAFASAVDGSYYGKLMAKAEKEGRVGAYPAIPGLPVHTAHDIGVYDYHSIWFFQVLPNRWKTLDDGKRIQIPGEVRHLHYYQNCGEGMPFYAEYCDEQYKKRGWKREGAIDFFPHDAKVREWGTGKSRIEQMVGKGFRPRIVTRLDLGDGINATRALISMGTFDAAGCSDGIAVLKNYKRQWNDRTGAWMSQPLHNEASHGADAERTLACAHREIKAEEPGKADDKLTYGKVRDDMLRKAKMRERTIRR